LVRGVGDHHRGAGDPFGEGVGHQGVDRARVAVAAHSTRGAVELGEDRECFLGPQHGEDPSQPFVRVAEPHASPGCPRFGHALGGGSRVGGQRPRLCCLLELGRRQPAAGGVLGELRVDQAPQRRVQHLGYGQHPAQPGHRHRTGAHQGEQLRVVLNGAGGIVQPVLPRNCRHPARQTHLDRRGAALQPLGAALRTVLREPGPRESLQVAGLRGLDSVRGILLDGDPVQQLLR